MKYAELGSISSGTLRIEDLLPTFATELDTLLKIQPRSFPRAQYRSIIRLVNRYIDNQGFVNKIKNLDGSDLVTALEDAISDFAPPYAYFGAHPGDGSDFGFWLVEDFEDDFDGLKVSDLSEVPAKYRGEVLQVSDHGNLTLYFANKGKFKEIWGIV